MNRILRLLAIVAALSLIAIAWFWWNRPQRVDMTANVPADSLIYLEANGLPEIAAAITDTDTWQRLAPYLASPSTKKQKDWLTYLVKITGIGSTASVLAARSQVALVLLDLNSVSNGETLEYTKLAALIVETHTSAARIKPAVEAMLAEIAGRAYGQPKFERLTDADGEFVRWIAPDGQRRIVASFDGSVVVVGNDERAVTACLAARRGQRPSLLHQTELEEMRLRLHASEALAFGYVAAAKAPRLISESAPVYLGKLRLPEELQKLLAAGAAKIIGAAGWSVRSVKGGFEDRYFVSLKPNIVARLRTAFQGTDQGLQGAWEFLPTDVASITSYNFSDASASWDALNGAISSQVDFLSAVFLTTLSAKLFEPYGIDQPNSFLKAIKPEILTVRIEPASERALVIAKIADRKSLREFVSRRFGPKPRTEQVGGYELAISPDEQFAASLAGDYFFLGSPEDIRRCLTARATRATMTSSPTRLAALTHYLERPGKASIVTYAKDNERVRVLIATLARIRGSRSSAAPDELDHIINQLPYATTETSLGEDGLERRTRSPFGQFGSLVSLLAPEPVPATAK